MDKITFCIPSKSNLRYLKTCIPSIRENAYRKDHDIIVFVDSDEDGTVDWLENVKDEYNVKYFVNSELGNRLYGIGKAYDFCIEQSTTDIFMIFHADMILGINADLYAYKHLKEKIVVCATRIEPPIHPNAGEKILMDFGMWPEEFNCNSFDEFVQLHKHTDKITNGIFAPWMMYKKDFLAIGGHDPILKSCREDSDVFNRMHLAEYEFIQSWNSLVYHFTGRGAGSFDGDESRHDAWKKEMSNSTKEFIRKWGSNVNHTAFMKPIIPHKYNIHAVIENCSLPILEAVEPWFSGVLLKTNSLDVIFNYIQKEQANTTFDLLKRVQIFNEKTFDMDTIDILIEFDARKFTQNSFNILQNLSDIITETNDLGEFDIDCFRITITNLRTYENQLIQCNS